MKESGFSNHNALHSSHLIVFYQKLKLGTKFYLQIDTLYINLHNINCVQIYFKGIKVLIMLCCSNDHVTHKPLR